MGCGERDRAEARRRLAGARKAVLAIARLDGVRVAGDWRLVDVKTGESVALAGGRERRR